MFPLELGYEFHPFRISIDLVKLTDYFWFAVLDERKT